MKIVSKNKFSGKTHFYTIASSPAATPGSWINIVTFLVGKMGVTCAFGVVYLYTSGKCSTVKSLISICVSVLRWGTLSATNPVALVSDLSTQNTTFLILRSGTSATRFVAARVLH